ncbi:MAG: hypothetical protein U9R36_05045, partial [Elusimicrobiota bacterium]|nr:hypothetical protein [Elusimicrobiota bacterium]
MKVSVKKYIGRLKIVHWLLIAVLAGSVIQYIFFPQVRLSSDRLTYLHYNAVKFKLILPGKYRELAGDIKVKVFKDGESVETLEGSSGIDMEVSDSGNYLQGYFPLPWGARDGFYTARAYAGDRPLGWPVRFKVVSRIPVVNLDSPLKVLTLESTKELRKFKIEMPEGKIKGYEGIFDWIDYMGGNTLWYMAGQTAAYRKDYLTRDLPWVRDNLE